MGSIQGELKQNLKVGCELVLAVVVSLLLPLDRGVVHLVDQDHQVLHPRRLHQHRVLSGLGSEDGQHFTSNKIIYSLYLFNFQAYPSLLQSDAFTLSCSSLMSRRAMI